MKIAEAIDMAMVVEDPSQSIPLRVRGGSFQMGTGPQYILLFSALLIVAPYKYKTLVLATITPTSGPYKAS